MKTEIDVHKEHDILVAIILGEIPCPLPEKDMLLLKTIAHTLCWVLEHDHNTTCQTLFDGIHKTLAENGYVFERCDN